MRFLSSFHSMLLGLPPELAHNVTLKALRYIPVRQIETSEVSLRLRLLGLDFPNPVGMAAGFDKNAYVADKLLTLGFGFVEVGGVTPRPQKGNPCPRVFRLLPDNALVNRLGFNNDGLQALRLRLETLRATPGIIGVNLGANKDSADRVQDYLDLLMGLDGLVDFVTLNISSPNTPGLRELQDKEQLATLLQRMNEKRETIKSRRGVQLPVLVKIAPDLTEIALDDIAALALVHHVDGMIVSNTTLSRPNLKSAQANEAGGLSGQPLFALSTRVLAQMRLRVGKEMVLIGVGGVDSGEAAWAKICAGAHLIQLYTGLVYKGLPLLDEIKTTLAAKLAASGYSSLSEAVGCEAAAWARKD